MFHWIALVVEGCVSHKLWLSKEKKFRQQNFLFIITLILIYFYYFCIA